MGGEKSGISGKEKCSTGSPPRGRGKVPPFGSTHPKTRITPAWAGKRPHLEKTAVRGVDHPRVGGEKLSSGAYVAKDKGSPPRRRGKGVNVNCSADDIGITPAWAGKSICLALPITAPRDHPRMGGEKAELTAAVISAMGSPPRRRGKGKNTDRAERTARITPAWAGKRQEH